MLIPDGQKWRKSSYCTNANCVEVARLADHYLIRDSKSPAAAPLCLTADDWLAFVRDIVAGEFMSA